MRSFYHDQRILMVDAYRFLSADTCLGFFVWLSQCTSVLLGHDMSLWWLPIAASGASVPGGRLQEEPCVVYRGLHGDHL